MAIEETSRGGEAPREREPAGYRNWGHLVSVMLGTLPPPLLLLLSIVSIQIGAAFAVGLFPALGPGGMVLLRVGIAAVLLLAMMRPALDGNLRRHLWLVVLFGAIMAATNWSFYQALARIPLGTAVTIEFMGPLLVGVASSRRPMDFFWLALAGLGVALLAPEIGTDLDPAGVAFAGIGGAGWSAFILLSKPLGRAFPDGSAPALGMAVAALMLVPAGYEQASAALTAPWLLLGAAAIAVLSTAIPFTLEFQALQRMPARTYGVLITLEPGIAALVGIVLLHEALTVGTGAAIACVTTAALGSTLCNQRR